MLQVKVPYLLGLSSSPTVEGSAHLLSGVPISPTLCLSPTPLFAKFSKQAGQTCSMFRNSLPVLKLWCEGW